MNARACRYNVNRLCPPLLAWPWDVRMLQSSSPLPPGLSFRRGGGRRRQREQRLNANWGSVTGSSCASAFTCPVNVTRERGTRTVSLRRDVEKQSAGQGHAVVTRFLNLPYATQVVHDGVSPNTKDHPFPIGKRQDPLLIFYWIQLKLKLANCCLGSLRHRLSFL